MSDRQRLFATRVSIVIFAALVLAYAIAMKGTPIYDLVSSAYQVTLVGAFVPLVLGLYWKRAPRPRERSPRSCSASARGSCVFRRCRHWVNRFRGSSPASSRPSSG